MICFVVVHLARRALVYRQVDLARLLDVGQRKLGRCWRLLLDVARHQVHILLAHLAGGLPIGHAGRATVGDEDLQIIGTLTQSNIWSKRFTSSSLAQHTVTAGTTLEINLTSPCKLSLSHRRCFGVDILMHVLACERRTASLIGCLSRTDRFVGRIGIGQCSCKGQGCQ